MKAFILILALHGCLSSGAHWTRYPETYPKFEYHQFNQDVDNIRELIYNPYNGQKLSGGEFSPAFLPPNVKPNLYNKLIRQVTATKLYPVDNNNGNHYLNAHAKKRDDVVNIYSNPTDKNYAGNELNELLRKNGLQNNLSFNNKRAFGDDVDVKRGVKNVKNYVYFLNKTSSNQPSGQLLTSSLTASLPAQGNLLESNPGSQYWVNENNQNYKESYWIRPHPSWNQPPRPFPYNPYEPSSNNLHSGDKNNWNQVDTNQEICFKLTDLIGDFSNLLQTSNTREIRYGLKTLFKVIRVFILRNNLKYASFNTVVHEIRKVLLNRNNDNNILREDEIVQILQEFKNRDLNNFLLEIRLKRVTSLQVAVSKLALLLNRLKQVLVHRRYSEESIRLVLNRAVQWSVPIVGYYFEKECKIKTQQYIVQNLQVALNVNLESVKHVGSVDELQIDATYGNLGNKGELDHLGNWENSANIGSQVHIGNLLISDELEHLGGNSVGLGGSGHQENFGGLGNLETSDSFGGIGNQGNLGSLVGLGNQPSLAGLGGLDSQRNQEDLGGLGSLENPAGLAGLGILGNVGGVGNVIIPKNLEA